MPKCKEKIEEIKIRLTMQEKQIIKDTAKSKGITMSKLILDNTIPTSKQYLECIDNQEIIKNRAVATEIKIQKLKHTLETRRASTKKNKIFNFARK